MHLTDRQLKALKLYADGHPQKTVAKLMNVELKTVGAYFEQARYVNQCGNTAQLIAMAFREGLLT